MNRLTEQEQIEERISAYLDGELSADETAAVEQLLTERGDLRQLHDELLAVRASLKALYQHRLDEDFSQRVLRQAERAVLSRPATTARPAADEAGELSENGSASRGRMPRPFSSLRSWLWAGAAIAAAVLLMIDQSQQEGPEGEADGDRRLAQKNDNDEKIVGLRQASTDPKKTGISAQGGFEDTKVDRLAAPQSPPDPGTAGIAAATNSADLPKTSAEEGATSRTRFKGLPANSDGKARRGGGRPPVARYDFVISRRAADSGAIEKLLARRKITLAAAPPDENTPDSAITSPKPLKPQAAITAGQQFDVIYLQGPPRQIEAVLLALHSQSGVKRWSVSDEKSDALKDRSDVDETRDDVARRARKKATKETNSQPKRPKDKTAAGAGEPADATLDAPKPGDQESESDDLPASQKRKLASTAFASTALASTAGRAWRDAREARSLAESYAKRPAQFGAVKEPAKKNVALVPNSPASDTENSAPAKQLGKDVGAKATSGSDMPALVTVKLVFRLIDSAGEEPPAANVEPRN